MPFNSVLLVSTAHKSADLWQQLACLPERISSDQMLDLVICFPLQQLSRWALFVWTYLCVSPYPHRHPYHATSYYSDDSDDDGDSDDDDGGGRGGGGGGGGASSSVNNGYHYYCYGSQSDRGYDSSSHSD